MVIERDLPVNDEGITITDLYLGNPHHAVDVPPGLWRVRLSVTGRDTSQVANTESSERHLIQMWPTTTARPRETLRGPDTYAQLYLNPPSGQISTPTDRAAFNAIRTLRALVRQTPPPEFAGSSTTVEVASIVDASVVEVFSVFNRLEFWLGMGGRPGHQAGQTFSVYVDMVGGVLRGSGEVISVDPNERMVYRWSWSGPNTVPAEPTTVDLSVSAEESRCAVLVRHTDVPTELAQPVRALWEYYLPRLGAHAHGRHPGPHPWRASASIRCVAA